MTLAIIFYTFYVFNFRFLPRTIEYLSLVFTVIMGILYNTNVILLLWSYFRVLCTSPGYINEKLKYEKSELYIQLKTEHERGETRGICAEYIYDLETNPGNYEPVQLNNRTETQINDQESFEEIKGKSRKIPQGTPHVKKRINFTNANFRY